MAYGNPHKKKMSNSKKAPKKTKSTSTAVSQVGQRKSYRMTGKAPGN